jgi:hypothetical protein
MPKLLLATTAMLLALGGQAMAQEQQEVQNEQTQAPAGETEADPEGAGSTTGGVTAPAKEMLPDDTSEAPVDAQAGDAAGSPTDPAAAQPAAGTAGVVSAAVVQELYQMALEQQMKTTTPAAPKSEETKQAEQKAIAAHRDGLFARMEEATGS